MKEVTAEQNSPEWLAARLGIPTASSASKMVTSTGTPSKSLKEYATKLAADTFAGVDTDAWDGNKYTERGHEIEGEARQWLSFARDIEITEVGFCTDDEMTYGASPDGRILADNGLVEIKCLPKQHVKALLYWHANAKPPTDYIAQIHMQMLVMDADYCLLCYYHPDLPKAIIRIERDPVFEAALNTQIEACLKQRAAVLKILKEL